MKRRNDGGADSSVGRRTGAGIRCGLAMALIVVSATSARAGLIYDTMDPLKPPVGFYSTEGGSKYFASGFRTTATDYVIQSIGLGVARSDAATGTFTVSIYDSYDTGGDLLPLKSLVQQVYSGSVTNLSTYVNYGTFEVTGLNVTLAPSTVYYVAIGYPDALHDGDPFRTKDIYWQKIVPEPAQEYGFGRMESPTPFAGYEIPTANGPEYLKMSINASGSSVPEIDSSALGSVMAIALSTLGLLERRRRAMLSTRC